MFNVYNTNDQALASDSNALWWHGQVLEKPFNLFLDSFWANFNGIGTDDKLSPDDERQWIEDAFETGDPLSATDHSAATIARRHRRWTELSFFFRALSRPAGLGPVDGLDTENSKRNFPVTDLAGSGGLTLPGTGAPQYPSHTFLTTAPLTEMWPLYKFLAETALK